MSILDLPRNRGAPLAPGIYRELVALLFTNLVPVLTMSVAYVSVCVLIASRRGDILLDVLVGCGTAAAVGRFAVVLAFRRRGSTLRSDEDAWRWERRYACGSFAFAILLGLTGLRIVGTMDPDAEMLITCVLFGYATGVICRLAVRPWICLPSLLLGAIPIIVGLLDLGGVDQTLLAGLCGLFLLGSLNTVGHLHRVTVGHLTAERTEADRARRDPLTGLPNRLSVFEHLTEALAGGAALAVHFIDLDRFKDANDRCGHAAGDALLRAAADRLSACLRPGDIAARLGGDEFLVVQMGVAHETEAEMLARRLVRSIQPPFTVGEHRIAIGASVGVALSRRDPAGVDALVARADAALYAVKMRGRNGFALAGEAEPVRFEADVAT